jgi:nucleotide-binding universal stress UspA family protein
MQTVVVGVDGSAGAERALLFAAKEARFRGARLRAVTVWHLPAMMGSGGMAGAPTYPVTAEQFEQGATKTLEKSLAAVEDELKDLSVQPVVKRGNASDVLIEQADGADLLVVGTRGHGGFVGLLLGSVSQQCAHHAKCPIAIVPPARDS